MIIFYKSLHNRGVTVVAVSLAIELLIMTGVGFVIKRKNIVQEQFTGQVSAFIMNACLPCLVFHSMTSIDLSIDILQKCGVVLLLATLVNLILLGIGQIFYIAMGKTGSARLARYSVVILHATFMGLPVIDALFGVEGNMYYAIFMIPLRLLYYGFSKIMLSPPGTDGGINTKAIVKAFLTPSIIVMPFAIAFGMLGIHLPTPVANCVANMAKLCSPLGLILCGTVIAKYDIKKLFCLRYMRMPMVRNIAMPALFVLLTRPLYMLGVDEMIIDMIIIYTAFPIASLLPTFILQYDPDPDVQFEAASITIIATLLSIITIPFWCFIIQTVA